MMIITDGTGRGFSVGVSELNRLQASSITQGANVEALSKGENFNVNTGYFTLTSGNESAVLYIKNTGEKDLFLAGFGFATVSSNGTGPLKFAVYRNPSTGSLISTATAVEINANLNFGSSNELDVDAYRGFEGATFTDGQNIGGATAGVGFQVGFNSAILLKKGNSLGLSITPPTGNTSMEMLAFVATNVFQEI